MLRPLRIAVEIIASLVGIAVALVLFLVWRLNSGPLHATFLTPAIESSIEALAPDAHVSIAHTLLGWDAANRFISLHADDVQVKDKGGRIVADVPEFNTRLSLIGMLFGQFFPVDLTIDHPRIELERQQDGAFTFGGAAATGTPDSEADDETLKDSLSRIASRLAHAFFTHHLSIHDAVFEVHDKTTGNDWSVKIPEIALERSGGDLAGHAVLDVTQQNRVSTINVLYTYDRREGVHRLAAHLNDITPAFFAGGHPATLGFGQAANLNLPLSGDIGVAFDSSIDVAAGNIDLHGGAGFLDSHALWDKPRAVKSLDIKADYDRDAGILDIPAAVIDFNGPRLSASGKAAARDLVKPFIMDFALGIQLDNLPMDQYGELWPQQFIPGAHAWIAANLSQGKFDHAEATLKGTLDLNDMGNSTLSDAQGKVSASGGRVRYMDEMPQVEGVNAEATFDMNQLTAQISGGGIDAIRIVPFALLITGFQDNVQNISIPLKVAGPIPDILTLIDHPPLGYTHAIGLAPDDVRGDAAAEIDFRFPLLRDLAMKDIGVVATGTLTDVASSRFAKGVALTKGNLALKLDGDHAELAGPAMINGAPLQVAWQQTFVENSGKPWRQAALSGALTAEQWDLLDVKAFDGSHGPINASLQMTQPDHVKTLFNGTVDMTEADMRIDWLNWKKPAHIAAAAVFAAEKNGDGAIDITSIDLHGPQLNVKGTASLTDDGDVETLSLNPMIVGRTNATLHFARLEDGAQHFDATGEALDISGFKPGPTPDNAPPPPKEFRIKVGKLYTSDNGFIARAEGYAIRDAKGWSEISLNGLADGSHALKIDLTMRSDGGRDLSLTCDDFGKALKGLGFTDEVRGGELNIHGGSDAEDPRAIVGKISVGSYTVGNLPLLAVLMNAASPFGFAGLFTGSMDFDHLRGKFRWEGDTIRLNDVHAAGAAVGINVNGRIDMNNADANLRGTMVPFSMVNSVIGAIPIIGDLFTGGKDQGIFAVEYSITGPLDAPKTNVNPVSLLTPGFLRNLFFGGSDDEDETPDEKAAKP